MSATKTSKATLSKLPVGCLMYEAFIDGSFDSHELPKHFERAKENILRVWLNKPNIGFMSSMLCSMALPVTEPENPNDQIVRRNGNTTLIIQPQITQEYTAEGYKQVVHGLPWGKHARLILYYVMSEAIYSQSREISLGRSFSDWCNRMGQNSRSGGKRGTRTKIAEQMRRIISCQWVFRTEKSIQSHRVSRRDPSHQMEIPLSREGNDTAFSVQEMKISNSYNGFQSNGQDFVANFVLTEEFYNHLLQHAVPLNDWAVVALSHSSVALDLYTWLCSRLPRVPEGEFSRISWDSLIEQIGPQDGAVDSPKFKAKFRQNIREAWDLVSAVYPEARRAVDFDTKSIVVRYAPRPAKVKLPFAGKPSTRASQKMHEAASNSADNDVTFPDGSIHYSQPFAQIAKDRGRNNSLDMLAERFRDLVGGELSQIKGERLIKRWERFCESFPPAR